MRRATWLASGVLALVGLLGGSLVSTAAGADEAGSPSDGGSFDGGSGFDGGFTSFDARATAEGVRFSVGAPNFVAVETFMDGGGPIAQAVVDGLGNSQAFASSPYPGDLFISGPGLLAGLTGLPSPPAYPFYVTSSYPTAESAKVAQPGYELNAESKDASSSSSASSGGAAGDSALFYVKSSAKALRDATTGDVVSEATVQADIINIAGVLKIVSGHVKAKATRLASGELKRESSMTLDGVSIGGTPVGFSDQGFVLAGQGSPIPDDSPMASALEQAGITVKYLKGYETENGVVSPGFVVTQEFQVPSGPMMVFNYIFGRAMASASATGGFGESQEIS